MTYELAKRFCDGDLKIETINLDKNKTPLQNNKKLKFSYFDNDNNLVSEEFFYKEKHILIALGFKRRLVPMDKSDYNKMLTII